MKITMFFVLVLILTATFNPFLAAQPAPPDKISHPPGGDPPESGKGRGAIIEQGIVKAERVSRLNVQCPKKYISFPVKKGDFVREGQILMELDPAQLESKMAIIQMRVSSLQAQLTAMEKVVVPLKKLELQSTLWEAKQAEKKAAMELTAQEKMLKEGLASTQQRDEARAAFEMAQLKRKATELQLSNFKAGPEQASIASLKAELQIARHQQSVQEDSLGPEAMKAPHAGVVISLSEEDQTPGFSPKNVINFPESEGQEHPINLQYVVIADVAEVIVSAYVYQGDINRIRIGGRALVRADYAPDRTFTARVDTISPVAIRRGSTSVFQVEARVDNRENLLKPGTTVEVTFLTGAGK